MASDSEPRKFLLRPPRPLQKSHFGDENVFISTAISVHKHLQIAINDG